MSSDKILAKPFLRWAGGKQWLVPELEKFLPKTFNDYHEPFLGGGSIFIHLKSTNVIKRRAYLSDLNKDLINAYECIRDNPLEVVKKLKQHPNEKEYYYLIRRKKFRSKTSRAAQFIYLNKASYNGIYRVNLMGEYNVPFGNKDYFDFITEDNIKQLSELFKDCKFECQDFRKALRKIKKGDLVFLDPPYTVAHELNGFIKYNQKIFSWDDQIKLKEFIKVIKKKKAKFILTNAAHHSIEGLYDGVGNRMKLGRFSVIGGKNAKRDKYNELVFFK